MVTEVEFKVVDASSFLKAMSGKGRLAILYLLIQGEKSVSEIHEALAMQPAVASQHLGRLRLEGLVSARRDGKRVYYKIADKRVLVIAGVLGELFCGEEVRAT